MTTPAAAARPRTPTRWRKASTVGEWYKSWRGHMRRDALTLDLAAKLLERELRTAKGLDRATAFIRARRATRALYRAAAHADACADNLDKFWRAFEEQYPGQERAAKGNFDPNS